MSEQLKLAKTAKRVNSSTRPGYSIVLTGDFRGPIEVINPTVDVEIPSSGFDYNYLIWEDSANDLTRYYWIRHKTYFPDGIVRLSLEEDVLATFRDDIDRNSFLVERSSSVPNPYVVDTAPVTLDGVKIDATSADPFVHYRDGWYVVGIAGCYDSSASFAESGGVFYYLCSPMTVFNLLTWLSYDGASGEWADYDPISRIVSIRYFPISLDAYGVELDAVIFAHTYDDKGTTRYADFDWQGRFIQLTNDVPGFSHDVIYTKEFTMHFSHHWQYAADRIFLDFPPYRELVLYAGAFGKIDIPINLIRYQQSVVDLYIKVIFDMISGLSRIEVYLDNPANGRLVYSSEDYSMTVDCAITSQSYNKYSDILARDLRKQQNVGEQIARAGAGAGGLVVGALTGNPIAAAAGLAALGSLAATQFEGQKQYAMDSYALSIPDVHTKGSNGSYSMIEKPWRLLTISHLIEDFPFDYLGHACNKFLQMAPVAGYVKCKGASIASDKATLEEKSALNEFLNTGFYKE